jgi:transcriptional regulator with GAF, ATPase, and Fis domain
LSGCDADAIFRKGGFEEACLAQWDIGELKLLYGVSQMLLQDCDYGELLSTILDATIDGLGAERGFVLLQENGEFGAVTARNYRSEALNKAESEFSTSIAANVVASGRALLVADALNSESFGSNASVQHLSLRSVLCAPLANSDEVFAVIYLENRKLTNFFTERQRQLLDEICSLAAPRIRTAVAMQRARQKAAEIQVLLNDNDGILTADTKMAELLDTVHRVSATDLPILIQGETGTGKELVARAVYRNSNRAHGKYLVLNCAALPPTLIESELFGYVRGAFTGATRDRIGLIGAAHRGTLFLDELGELPLELQSRLLRVLQSGEFNRIGSVQTETADVRFIAATNRDLEREVEEGRFRRDLYFRLSPITLKLPPLRTRPHDIHILVEHFLNLYSRRYAKQAPKLSDQALAVLAGYHFPGNVRELEGEMARLIAVCSSGSVIPAEALDERFRGIQRTQRANDSDAELAPMSLAEMEKRLILSVLKSTAGNRTQAAAVLGITREGLRTKIQRLGIQEDVPAAPAR